MAYGISFSRHADAFFALAVRSHPRSSAVFLLMFSLARF